MIILQRVINQLKKINVKIRPYVICLILSRGRKNCTAMARSVGISSKNLYTFLQQSKYLSKEMQKHLFESANKTSVENVKRALVIDPTALIKRYAQLIEKLGYDKAGSTKHVERCLVPLYASVIDKNVKIPIALNFWVQEKVIGKRKYKSKRSIARDLICELKHMALKFDYVSLDGAFPFNDMFDFFEKEKISFSMRIAKTRCIITTDNTKAQLQFHPKLKLHRNSREKTIKAKLTNGREYFFTIQKRKNMRNEWEAVYIISNMDLAAKEQLEMYDQRWPQEKINRTTKQKFGSEHCQALEESKQRAHILAGFVAYTILETSLNDKQKKSVDELVNFIRDYHFDDLKELLLSHKKSKYNQRCDCVDKRFLKPFQNFSKNAEFNYAFDP